jgi:acyl-CoA synthetase (AMP-forming)/AMP-acid ligase II
MRLKEEPIFYSFGQTTQMNADFHRFCHMGSLDIKIIDDKGSDCSVNDPTGLVIRGHNVIKGYYTKPEKTKIAFKNDWFSYPKNKSIAETLK